MKYPINSDRSFTHIIVGKVQSGKTGEIIEVCNDLIEVGITPVVIVRNRHCDMQQFGQRFGMDKSQTFETQQLVKGKVCVVLGNASQIKKIHNKLIESNIEYSIISDEGDIHFQSKKRNKKPTEIAFEELREDSNNIFCFTATVASLVMNENNPHRIYELHGADVGRGGGRNYFGVDNFKHISTRATSTYEAPNNDTGFQGGLLDTADMHLLYTSAIERKKTWVIHNSDRRRFVQYSISDWIQENYGMFVVIVYNGDGIYLHIPKKEGGHTYVQYEGDGIPSIGRILTICKNYPYLTVVCGELASRGISFVSDDFTTHCDFQYYRCGSNPHGEQLLQACRLSGVYQAPIGAAGADLTFFCTDKTWELITQHYKMCDQPPECLVECFKDSSMLVGQLKRVCRPQLLK